MKGSEIDFDAPHTDYDFMRLDSGAQPTPEKPLFVSIGDLELKPIDWLIEDVLEAGTLSAIVGPSGSCKSFVALDMALSIASGQAYNGKPVKRGTVLFCAGEGKLGITRRVEAWCRHNEVYRHGLPFYVSEKAILMHDASMLEKVRKEAAEIGNVSLIMIDTLSRSFGGHNENNPQDMGAFVRECDGLKDLLNCTVTVVHHTGHGAADRARGHSSFYAALDSEILTKNVDDHNIQISSTKMKDAEPFKTMQFLKVLIPLGENVDSLVLQLVPTREKKTSLTGNQQLGFVTYTEATKGQEAASKLHLDEWRPLFYARHTGDNAASKKDAFRRVRNDLVDKGFLSVKDDYYTLGDKARHTAT
jgi:hypothetical protein